MVDVGGQDGQQVIYATDQEGPCRTNPTEPLSGTEATPTIFAPPIRFTFYLRSDTVPGPVGGENHGCQVSPGRVATQVQTTATSAGGEGPLMSYWASENATTFNTGVKLKVPDVRILLNNGNDAPAYLRHY